MSKTDVEISWQPACKLQAMRQRATMLSEVRAFFVQRAVLEVETPALYPAANPDPMIDSYQCQSDHSGIAQLFLQTSPEFAMKRLLAAGSGAIYQICKAFRQAEAGRFHNPEFTILEWYRPGFTLDELMDEVQVLLDQLLPASLLTVDSQRLSYQQVFLQATGLDPLTASINDFAQTASQLGYPEAESLCAKDHSLWLDFLFSHAVQPQLPRNSVLFVYDYPRCQAALARINPQQPTVAQRVEVFVNGLELGNGYQELTDADEQRQRFQQQIQQRQQSGKLKANQDEALLAALQAGMPETAGIALGLDRVLMLALGVESIADVLTFPCSNWS